MIIETKCKGKTMSKHQEFNSTIIVKCTKKLKDDLKDLAHKHKMNISEKIRALIVKALN